MGKVNWRSVAVSAGAGFISGAAALSPVGPTGQIIINASLGAASYVADCKVNNAKIDPVETISATVMGGVVGWMGGPGVNQNYALTKVAKYGIRTLGKEAVRANRQYAVKAISRTKTYLYNIIANSAYKAGISFTTGAIVSNVIVSATKQLSKFLSRYRKSAVAK